MAYTSLTINPLQPGVSNLDNPGLTRWQWYEVGGASTTTPIMLPESGKVAVTISGTFNVDVDVTASPPSAVDAGSAVWVKTTSPGTLSAATAFLLEGYTAFRLTVNSGTPVMKVKAYV